MPNVNDLNIPLSVTAGDSNTRSSNWWSFDKENVEIRDITSVCGYSQIINQRNQMTKESSSFIDLIFTSPVLISNTGVELSLFEKCHCSLIWITAQKMKFSIKDFLM